MFVSVVMLSLLQVYPRYVTNEVIKTERWYTVDTKQLSYNG